MMRVDVPEEARRLLIGNPVSNSAERAAGEKCDGIPCKKRDN